MSNNRVVEQTLNRRRMVTRRSGFTSHPDRTGKEFKTESIELYLLPQGENITIVFNIPDHEIDDLVAFGGWFYSNQTLDITKSYGGFKKIHISNQTPNNWHKFGSLAPSNVTKNIPTTTLTFTALKDTYIGFYNINCGIVSHQHLEWAKSDPLNRKHLNNIDEYAPEANFYTVVGNTEIICNSKPDHRYQELIYLKACNRCARFLPININNERLPLSFSNHCTENTAPCTHSGFSNLKNPDTNDSLQLHFGYQLECRYCKKFVVNAALNPQRTADQMKEDGTRRRHIELLLKFLLGDSPVLSYRTKNNDEELTTEIWETFGRECFKCKVDLPTSKSMHLDHTRPLALFWPLDKTATALCQYCNSKKHDKSPSEFYNQDEIIELSEITGLSIDELNDTSPNLVAIEALIQNLDKFFNIFCQRPQLQKVRDEKLTCDLFLIAIQKTLDKTPYGQTYNLRELYKDRNN